MKFKVGDNVMIVSGWVYRMIGKEVEGVVYDDRSQRTIKVILNKKYSIYESVYVESKELRKITKLEKVLK